MGWLFTDRSLTKGHKERIQAFKRAVWRTFKHHDPMADGMLTAYHKRQQTAQAINTELNQILGKRTHAP